MTKAAHNMNAVKRTKACVLKYEAKRESVCARAKALRATDKSGKYAVNGKSARCQKVCN